MQDLQKEQFALDVYGREKGKMPSTSEEWADLHKIAYPNYGDLPDEYKDELHQSLYEGTGNSTYQQPTIDTLGQNVQTAKEGVQNLSQPNESLRILQNAIRAKAGHDKVPLGTSGTFKEAGLTGMASLSQSLASRSNEISSNVVDFRNTITQMRGQYQDMASMALQNYEMATNELKTAMEEIAKDTNLIYSYAQKYPDAGINPDEDNLMSAQEKIQSSKIYQQATRLSGGSGTDTSKILSIDDAQKLGVPYGTTVGQAMNMGITPEDDSSDEIQKFELDAVKYGYDIDSGDKSWEEAFNLLKKMYPQASDEVINAQLGGGIPYNQETGEFDTSDAWGRAKD